MKKIEYEGLHAFEFLPEEDEYRKTFELAIGAPEDITILAQAMLTALQTATNRRRDAWADLYAKIEKDTGFDIGRQLLDYSHHKRMIVVLPNRQAEKIIRPVKPGDMPPSGAGPIIH